MTFLQNDLRQHLGLPLPTPMHSNRSHLSEVYKYEFSAWQIQTILSFFFCIWKGTSRPGYAI